MNSKRLNLQVILIFAIIVAVFLGSALLFSYLNTGAMKTAVEKETGLAISILTADIHTEYPIPLDDGEAMPRELAQDMDERLT